jgi:hypothetical protein
VHAGAWLLLGRHVYEVSTSRHVVYALLVRVMDAEVRDLKAKACALNAYFLSIVEGGSLSRHTVATVL